MFGRKKKLKKQPIDVEADIKAIKTFLKELSPDVKNIFFICQEMEKLKQKETEMSGRNAPAESLKKNLQEQIKLWDKMLTVYEFFDQDVDVNSERVKNIAKVLRSRAKELDIDPELKKKMNTEPRWTFNW
jgi:hypothetical protein